MHKYNNIIAQIQLHYCTNTITLLHKYNYIIAQIQLHWFTNTITLLHKYNCVIAQIQLHYCTKDVTQGCALVEWQALQCAVIYKVQNMSQSSAWEWQAEQCAMWHSAIVQCKMCHRVAPSSDKLSERTNNLHLSHTDTQTHTYAVGPLLFSSLTSSSIASTVVSLCYHAIMCVIIETGVLLCYC